MQKVPRTPRSFPIRPRRLVTTEMVESLCIDAYGMRGVRQHTHTLVLEGGREDDVARDRGRIRRDPNSSTSLVKIHVLSNLLTCLRTPYLKTVKLDISVRNYGEKLVEDILSSLSIWATKPHCHFAVDIDIGDLPDYCNLHFMKHLSYARCLTVNSRRNPGILSSAITKAIYDALEGSTTITKLSLAMSADDLISPIYHLLVMELEKKSSQGTNWMKQLKQLNIHDYEDRSFIRVPKLGVGHIALLKGLKDVYTDVQFGFWDLLAQNGICLSKIGAHFLEPTLITYISYADVASALRVLYLGYVEWPDGTSPEVMQEMGPMFKEHIVPKICDTIEELYLGLSIDIFATQYLLNERDDETSLPSQMITPFSASEWVGQHVFKNLKKLDAFVLIKGALELSKLGAVLNGSRAFHWPKANSLRLHAYWITRPSSQYNLNSLEYFRGFLKNQRYHEEERRFRNCTELILKVIHMSFKSEVPDRIWRTELEYFFSGDRWHPRCPVDWSSGLYSARAGKLDDAGNSSRLPTAADILARR